MVSKFGKEKKLLGNEEFRIKYGTVDAVNLNSIYLCINSWVKPTEVFKYDSVIRIIRNNLYLGLKDKIDFQFFNENYIVDLDLRSSGMSLNKRSFLSLEITLYPKIKLKFNSLNLKERMIIISEILIESLKKNKLEFKANKK